MKDITVPTTHGDWLTITRKKIAHTSAFVLKDTPRDLGIELSPITQTSEGTMPRVEGMTMFINCSGDQGFNEGMTMQMDGR